MKKIAVIGGGAAGLVTLRHLAAKPQHYRCVLYEASDHVGGTWKYSQKITENGRKQSPISGAMYKNLVTNLPKEVMAYPDFPFDSKLPSFVTHEDVVRYLESYVEKFRLSEFIKYGHFVDKVSRLDNEWEVETTHNEKKTSSSFDAVFVCNGHYTTPYLPEVDGMNGFQGTVDHSRNYRTPDEYANKTVVLVGARASGQDISIDIAKVADRVILSHNAPNRLQTPLPPNLHQRLGIREFTQKGVIFQDGVEEEGVDHVLFCTGYRYSLPFVDDSCELKVSDERVTPLYKHIINVNIPSMFIIGICAVICPFPHFDLQVRYAIAWLENKFEKPEKASMIEWIDEDFRHKTETLGWKKKYAHMLGDLQWSYASDLANEARIDSIANVVRKIYTHTWHDRNTNVLNYRTVEFGIVNEDEYTNTLPIPIK